MTAKKKGYTKSTSKLLLAYGAATIAGGLTFGIATGVVVFVEGIDKIASIYDMLRVCADAVPWGIVLCIVSEILATILLYVVFMIRRSISRVSIVVTGVLVGVIPAFILLFFPVEGRLDVDLGYFLNGAPTLTGLARAGTVGLVGGLVGMLSGLAFIVTEQWVPTSRL